MIKQPIRNRQQIKQEPHSISLIPSSVGKALVFLTESYGWKVALRKFNSVFCEIKKENQKSKSILS